MTESPPWHSSLIQISPTWHRIYTADSKSGSPLLYLSTGSQNSFNIWGYSGLFSQHGTHRRPGMLLYLQDRHTASLWGRFEWMGILKREHTEDNSCHLNWENRRPSKAWRQSHQILKTPFSSDTFALSDLLLRTNQKAFPRDGIEHSTHAHWKHWWRSDVTWSYQPVRGGLQ